MDGENFNWVEARAECSVMKVFKRLAFGIKADLDTINRIQGEAARDSHNPPDRNLEVNASDARIEITRTIKSQTMNSVEFVREKSSIRVTSDFSGGPKFLASPSLSTDGHCVAIVDGCELELWNVRRKALDELFFGAV